MTTGDTTPETPAGIPATPAGGTLVAIQRVERLPFQAKPGFDCRRDPASCPACQGTRKGDHGVSGGSSWFGLRAELDDGRRVALEFMIQRVDYPASVPRSPGLPSRASGALAAIHAEVAGGAACTLLGDGHPCDDGPRHGGYSCLAASELYDRYGDDAGGEAQSPEFWAALERLLDVWASRIPPLS